MYSQKALLGLFLEGKVGDEKRPPKHIETVISNVFMFDENVYKVYKNDNEFFNNNFQDISGREDRLVFANADFEWNRQLSPEVYVRLQGVCVKEGNITFVSKDDAEELVLITKLLPQGTLLFDHLQAKDLNEEDFVNIGRQFAIREAQFRWDGAYPEESLFKNMSDRLADVIAWVKDAEEYLSATERDKYTNQLGELIKQVYENDSSRVAIGLDFHSFNAFYIDHTLYPFDTYPPKASWRFAAPLLDIYRLASDVYALGGKKEFEALKKGYFERRELPAPDQQKEKLLIMYAALIMVSYLYMLARTDTDKRPAADRYLAFLREYAEQ